VARFVLEYFRGDVDRGVFLGGLLSTSQLVAIAVLLISVPLIFKLKDAKTQRL
jgi:prolipoprotein diacylglyceryltransferase